MCHLAYRENRYLLFLTENYAALEILKHYLQDYEGGDPAPSDQSDESKPWEMEPYVLFGSSFPKDKEYTQVSGEKQSSELNLRNLYTFSRIRMLYLFILLASGSEPT